MHRRMLLALAALSAALLIPAAAQAETIATPAAATDVREYQGIVVFSQWDPATSRYRLAIRRPGAPPELLPVAPSARSFEADIGPDSSGQPELIYQRCDDGCELYVYSLVRATGERPVRNANDPDNDDVEPTIWKGRIAWTRYYRRGVNARPIVYTKTLTAPRSRPSTRLSGPPQRRCDELGGAECGPTRSQEVEALELWGRNLGQIVRYACSVGCSGTSQTEVRYVRVDDRMSSLVAYQTSGLSGQSFAGPSFANGWLSWYRTCLGDPSACQGGRANPWRFNLRTERYGRGAGGPVLVHGFADTMTYHYRTAGCSVETLPEANENCRIEVVPSPDYAAAEPPLRD